MALFDHRVFRVNKDWWAAQVHSASGADYGTENPRITSERVFFSNLSDQSRNTLTTRIKPGILNRISHRSLLKVLRSAEDLGSHFPMAAYNAPSPEELGPRLYTDGEDLRWAARLTQAVRLEPPDRATSSEGIDFICLDDSALRKEIALSVELSAKSVLDSPERWGTIIDVIKATYADYEPERLTPASAGRPVSPSAG